MRLFVGGLVCCHGFDGTPVVLVASPISDCYTDRT